MGTALTDTTGTVAKEQLVGRINDCDSHEMIPEHLWGDIFGEAGQRLAGELSGFFAHVQGDASSSDPTVRDVAAIDAESIWSVKGAAAPSAIDIGRRVEVLDAMGINRQLIFPTVGLVGIGMYFGIDYNVVAATGGSSRRSELKELGASVVTAYNEWVISTVQDYRSDRLRMVGILMADSLEQMQSDLKHLLDSGVKAVMLPAMAPPAGFSPAAHELDPVWAMFAEADVPALLHFGTEGNFLDMAWSQAPELAPDPKVISLEFPTMGMHMLTMGPTCVENYTATMVLGGVFERHPNLRFGVIESTATWFPNLIERMTLANKALCGDVRGRLKLTPAEYAARNIRVTPFVFEPADDLFAKHPELQDVFVYSSDYPHIEGGKNSFTKFYDKVERLGSGVAEKFFVTNAEWLLPA